MKEDSLFALFVPTLGTVRLQEWS
ncbi:hypothetical protein LINPERHAP1_LOCUS36590 [Linum perenne]